MSDAKRFIEENPIDVIEKFGGIRPMATKLGVAATTIQGWKKRQSIPENRINDIINSANENEIMLANKPNIEQTIAQIKAKIEQTPNRGEADQPDEELMEFPGVGDEDDAPAKPTSFYHLKEQAPKIEKSEEKAEQKEEELSSSIAGENKSDSPVTPHISEKESDKDVLSKIAEIKATKSDEPVKAHTSAPAEQALKPHTPSEQNDNIAPRPQARSANAKASKKSGNSWIFPMLLGASIVGLAAIFWPVREDVQVQKERLVEIESSLNELKEDQSSFMDAIRDFLPEDAKAQLQEIRNQTNEIGAQVGELARQGGEIAKAAIGVDNIAALQGQISTLMGGASIEDIMARFTALGDSEKGTEQLNRAYGQLQGISESLDGRTDLLEKALIVARENSTALGETFEGVPNEELKAGALLLGLTQFRSALNRDNTPFEEDLALIYNMIGEDNTELRSALDHLAPQAESGVLSVKGLSDEFRSLAGDIAVSSLKGEDVSVGDQAGNRLSKVLKLNQNNDTNSGGNQVQAIQEKIDTGDLEGAYVTLSSLSGSAAETTAPFLQQLKATMAAQNFGAAIDSMILTAKGEITGIKPLNLKNITPSIVETLSPNTIVRDKESGVNILPQKSMNNNFKNLNIKPQE